MSYYRRPKRAFAFAGNRLSRAESLTGVSPE